MDLRDAGSDDLERIRELVESSMTTSYRLSPGQIESLSADQFDSDRLTELIESPEAILRVGESDEDVDGEVVVGFVEGRLEDERGEVNWLFVDPEHRGKGLGTQLFEDATEGLREQGADRVTATVLEANTEGHQFAERFDFEQVDERQIEIADESLVSYVYAEPSADVETEADEAGAETETMAETEAEVEPTTATADENSGERDFPNTETDDGTIYATTEDDRRIFVDTEEELSGTEDSFYPAYTDDNYTDQFGFYCGNCGSVDVSMDNMDRIECGNCGNSHASRSSDSYDESYL